MELCVRLPYVAHKESLLQDGQIRLHAVTAPLTGHLAGGIRGDHLHPLGQERFVGAEHRDAYRLVLSKDKRGETSRWRELRGQSTHEAESGGTSHKERGGGTTSRIARSGPISPASFSIPTYSCTVIVSCISSATAHSLEQVQGRHQDRRQFGKQG